MRSARHEMKVLHFPWNFPVSGMRKFLIAMNSCWKIPGYELGVTMLVFYKNQQVIGKSPFRNEFHREA